MLDYRLDWKTLVTYFSFSNLAAAPVTPETGMARLYSKAKSAVSTLYYKNDAGTEIEIGAASAVSGTSGQVAFFNSASTVTSDPAFTWDNTNKRVGIGGTAPAVQLHIQPSTPAAAQINLFSGSATIRAAYNVGRTAADGVLAVAGNTNEFSDIALAGDVIVRNATLNLLFAARNATGVIKFTTGATDSEKMRIFNNGFVTVGTAFSTVSQTEFWVHSTQGVGTTRGLTNSDYTSDLAGPQFRFRKGRGTLASPAAVNASDQIGAVLFGGAIDTSDTQSFGAQINAIADSLWTASNSEGHLSFFTTPNASLTLAERFRVGSAGQWGIGGATFGTAGQYFRSGGAAAAPTWATIAITELATFSSATLAGQVTDETGSGLLVFATNPTLSGFTMANATDIVLNTGTGTKLGTATNQKLGFYNSAPVVQQTDGAALVNNVTAGGTTNQIDNFTDLTTYSVDASTIRNDIYQLARKLKIVDDALRLYGLLS